MRLVDFMHSKTCKRTNALCFAVVESKSGVARQATRSSIHRAMDPGLWETVLACTRIHYKKKEAKRLRVMTTFAVRNAPTYECTLRCRG